jgi:hypothetical protein
MEGKHTQPHTDLRSFQFFPPLVNALSISYALVRGSWERTVRNTFSCAEMAVMEQGMGVGVVVATWTLSNAVGSKVPV